MPESSQRRRLEILCQLAHGWSGTYKQAVLNLALRDGRVESPTGSHGTTTERRFETAELSPRATFKRWLREHLPKSAALLEGDIDHYLALVEREAERIAIAKRADAYCLECRSLMAVSEGGFHYCPYRNLGEHARAIAANKEKGADVIRLQVVNGGGLVRADAARNRRRNTTNQRDVSHRKDVVSR